MYKNMRAAHSAESFILTGIRTASCSVVLLIAFILSLLVVVDFGMNRSLTPVYDLTSDTSA